MQFTSQPDLIATANSLLGWWRGAGVDVVINEAPRNWLKPVSKAASTRTAPTTPNARAMPASPMPATLDAFTDWLMTDTAVFGDVPTRLRMRPEGDPASNLMIVTDCPEAGDVVAVRLLTGDAGQLFDTMLKALGRDRSSIYLATLAPSRPPSGRVDQAAVAALIPALRRHLALVRPAKLWLLGDAASRAVLALDAGAASGRLHSVNQDGATINTIATLHPRVLLREPKAKARAWEDMQRLMGLRN